MEKYPRLQARRRQLAPAPLPGSGATPASVLPLSSPPLPACAYAASFRAFADTVLATLAEHKDRQYVNRAKVLLTDQYLRLRRTVPIEHQESRPVDGHPCLFSVFIATYEAIERIELDVVPFAFDTPRPVAKPRSRKRPEPPMDITDPERIARLILDEGDV